MMEKKFVVYDKEQHSGTCDLETLLRTSYGSIKLSMGDLYNYAEIIALRKGLYSLTVEEPAKNRIKISTQASNYLIELVFNLVPIKTMRMYALSIYVYPQDTCKSVMKSYKGMSFTTGSYKILDGDELVNITANFNVPRCDKIYINNITNTIFIGIPSVLDEYFNFLDCCYSSRGGIVLKSDTEQSTEKDKAMKNTHLIKCEESTEKAVNEGCDNISDNTKQSYSTTDAKNTSIKVAECGVTDFDKIIKSAIKDMPGANINVFINKVFVNNEASTAGDDNSAE